MVIGIPLGSWLAFARFRERKVMVMLINTGMGLPPPVVVGLYVYMFLRRNGPPRLPALAVYAQGHHPG